VAFSTGLMAVLALLSAGQAAQETTCAAPDVPVVERPVKPSRPALPSCIDEAHNRHTCSNRTINAYNGEMERYGAAFDAYVAEINGYAAKLGAYMEAANAYAQCEQRVVMPRTLIQG
jgi:hypothetical protein